MAQLHFYVPDKIEERVRAQAEKAHMTVSRFLAELVKRELADKWPIGYTQSVFGHWQGEPLRREPEGDYEERTGF